MPSKLFDPRPRDDVYPSVEELKRTAVPRPFNPEEMIGPDYPLPQDDATTRAKLPPVTWPAADKDAPDYAHLEPQGREPVAGDKTFKLTAADMERLLAANAFLPKGPDGRFVIAFRGANLIDDADGDNDGAVDGVDHIKLEETRPDHQRFRCVIGYYHPGTRLFSAFRGSTVPNANYMTNYYKYQNGLGGTSTGANMLPTGCYVFRVGAHANGTLYPALRLTNSVDFSEDGAATVLRTKNDLTFKTDDVWENTVTQDHVHCAYSMDDFSSAGCQTVQGTKDGDGPWGHFQAVLKRFKNNTRIDYVLLTGRDASIAAYLGTTGRAADSDYARRLLIRLRPGSTGDAVTRLQAKLDMQPSGYFGPSTKEALVNYQRKNGLNADGIYSPALDEMLGWEVLKPAGVPAAAPVPVVAAMPAAIPAPAPQPAAQPAPPPTPAPAVQPAPTVAGVASITPNPVVAAPAPSAPASASPILTSAEAPAKLTPVASPPAPGPAIARPQLPPARVASVVPLPAPPSPRSPVPPPPQARMPTPPAPAPTPRPVPPPPPSSLSKPVVNVQVGRHLQITAETLKRFAPQSVPQYVQALVEGNAWLTRYAINMTPLRLCHFLAQISSECGRMSILEENLSYRSAARIREAWPSRFPTLAAAEPYVNQPQHLAEKVYGDRFDNGAGDGFLYRGRGLIQLTGRSNYREMGQKLGIVLEKNPELALDPKYALVIACEAWASRQLSGERDMNKLADANKIDALTNRISGGYTNIDDRRAAFEHAWEVWSSGAPPKGILDPDVLDRGDRGGRVEELNARLKDFGLFDGLTDHPPQHVYSTSTYRAVRILQAESGLAETGVTGPETWNALEHAVERGVVTRGRGKAGGDDAHGRPPRNVVARRLAEIRFWSNGLSILALAYPVTHIFVLARPSGNMVLWLPMVFAGAVFVAGMALWLAARPLPHWQVPSPRGTVRMVPRRAPGSFITGEDEPVRQGINM